MSLDTLLLSASLFHFDHADTGKRLTCHEDTANAATPVFIVNSCRSPWSGTNRAAGFGNELLGGFIHADDRESGVIPPLVDIENHFHMSDKVPA